MKCSVCLFLLSLLTASLLIFTGCKDDDDENIDFTKNKSTLNGIEIDEWMYQIQWLDEYETIDELDTTRYDMLVVEPGFNFNDNQYDVDYLVTNLKTKPNGDERLLIAYIDIGQAEDYRTYWGNDWVAPT